MQVLQSATRIGPGGGRNALVAAALSDIVEASTMIHIPWTSTTSPGCRKYSRDVRTPPLSPVRSSIEGSPFRTQLQQSGRDAVRGLRRGLSTPRLYGMWWLRVFLPSRMEWKKSIWLFDLQVKANTSTSHLGFASFTIRSLAPQGCRNHRRFDSQSGPADLSTLPSSILAIRCHASSEPSLLAFQGTTISGNCDRTFRGYQPIFGDTDVTGRPSAHPGSRHFFERGKRQRRSSHWRTLRSWEPDGPRCSANQVRQRAKVADEELIVGFSFGGVLTDWSPRALCDPTRSLESGWFGHPLYRCVDGTALAKPSRSSNSGKAHRDQVAPRDSQ